MPVPAAQTQRWEHQMNLWKWLACVCLWVTHRPADGRQGRAGVEAHTHGLCGSV